MASKLVNPPPIPSPHLLKQPPKLKNIQITLSASLPRTNYHPRFKHPTSKQSPIKAAAEEQRSGLLEDPKGTIPLLKSSIYKALEGINRGVFGLTSAKKTEIEDLVMQLESQNPTPNPTSKLEKVSGSWKLIYSTITILGSKRTKLGLRDFITLGDFLQIIDIVEGKAVNVIKFSATGLSLLNGELRIQASFRVESSSRVNIKYEKSEINPVQLMNLFRKNYDLLLSIFNPEGWLDITYVDETMRLGRDDKGNIFILERSTDNDEL